eukprot:4128054-Prorocentrum_lima.AAC.1
MSISSVSAAAASAGLAVGKTVQIRFSTFLIHVTKSVSLLGNTGGAPRLRVSMICCLCLSSASGSRASLPSNCGV